MKPEFIGQSVTYVGGYGGAESIESAAKTCTQAKGSKDPRAFVRGLLKRGHMSPIEFGFADFLLEVDRAIQQELTRHRHFSFNIESTRWCVAGTTRLKCKSHPKNMTVAELYEWKIRQKNNQWKRRSIKQYDCDKGEFTYAHPRDVIYNGKKWCVRITTKLGYEIECTPEHLLLTERGWVEAGLLRVGDSVYINGTEKLYKNRDWLYHQNITLNKTFVQIADEFGYNVNTVKDWAKKHKLPKKEKSYWNKGREPWNKGAGNASCEQVEALRKYHHDWHDKRRILKEDTKQYRKHKKGYCEICGSTTELQVHHIDCNRDNNAPSNLITLCQTCHAQIHKQCLETAYSDVIVSVEDAGILDVYDIVMKSEQHNFVANGFVAHNCDYRKKPLRFVTIPPKGWDVPPEAVNLLQEWCTLSAQVYATLLDMGAGKDYARKALPLATASKIRMAGNTRTWLEMLVKRLGPTVHPEAKAVAKQVARELVGRFVGLFDDLGDSE